MTVTQIQKKFPNYYPACGVPPQAKEQDLKVYRICNYGTIDKKAFYSHYELWKYEDITLKNMEPGWEDDIFYYSVSVFKDYKDAMSVYRLLSKFNPPAIIAAGYTRGAFGPCLQNAKKTSNRKSHVDWWLYEDAQPQGLFNEVKL